jgi:hypothetical protein
MSRSGGPYSYDELPPEVHREIERLLAEAEAVYEKSRSLRVIGLADDIIGYSATIGDPFHIPKITGLAQAGRWMHMSGRRPTMEEYQAVFYRCTPAAKLRWVQAPVWQVLTHIEDDAFALTKYLTKCKWVVFMSGPRNLIVEAE